MNKTKCALLFLYNQRKISPQPYYTENLGVQYIGAMLRKSQYDVTIINADYGRIRSDSIIGMLAEQNYNFVGISPCYLNMSDAITIAHQMKAKFPQVALCLGGHHATFCCKEILANEKDIDYIVRGEGERTALELLDVLEASQPSMPRLDQLLRIKGLSFRYKDKAFHNEPRELVGNLDEIPFPVRDPMEKAYIKGQHAMPLLCTTRGCQAHCSFCSTPNFYGGIWRARSAKNVVDEIQTVLEKYSFTQFYLTDDQFAGAGQVGRNHLQGIISEIVSRGLHKEYDLHFFLMVRADFFQLKNEDIIKKFPVVGFRDVFIGFESGDTSQLKLYTKGATAHKYREAIDLLRKHKVFVEGGFIIFNPYSTFTSLKNDAELIRTLGVPLLGYYTKQLLAYPGTKLYSRLIADGMLVHHDYKRIEFKYKDERIAELHSYLDSLFMSVENLDNMLFESIDFGIKRRATLDKIKTPAVSTDAQNFLALAEKKYKGITELNYVFFCALLEKFEYPQNLRSFKDLEHRYLSEYKSTCDTVIGKYLELNSVINIIKGTDQCYERM